MNRMVSHPVKIYEIKMRGDKEILEANKTPLLKTGIRDLLNKGRIIISTKWYSYYDVCNRDYMATWRFQVVYLGRKAIKKQGVRHLLRREHKKFNPYIISRLEA